MTMTDLRGLAPPVAGAEPASRQRRQSVATPTFAMLVLGLLALAAIRLAGLHLSVVDLSFDEAQYWVWSRELAFGYFSKPPLLAWIIAASDLVCGSGEACVRSGAPVIHLGIALCIYFLGKELYGERVGVWVAICFTLGPAMAFSSRIISTDVPLIFCWTVALIAYVKLWRGADWRWALLLGVALGLGMLAKYAMIFFLLCALAAACVDRGARALLMRRDVCLAMAIAALLFGPNIYWNLTHDLVTLRHTGDNISGNGFSLQPLRTLEFLLAQFAVAGPIVSGTFLVILARIVNPNVQREDMLMLALALPTLVLVAILALGRGGANANWAASAVVSMTVLAVAVWLRHALRYALWLTIGLGVAVQIALIAADAQAYRISVPLLGERQADVYRRTLGWRELGDNAAQFARAIDAQTIVAEGRAEVAALIYYLRHEPVRVLSWRTQKFANHHFDLARAFAGGAPDPILFIAYCASEYSLKCFYDDITSLGVHRTATGPNSTRTFYAFRLAAQRWPIEPSSSCG